MHLKNTFSNLISFSYVLDLNRTNIRSHCFLQVCCALLILYIFLFAISFMIHHFNLFLLIARFFFSWFSYSKKGVGHVTYLFFVTTPNSIPQYKYISPNFWLAINTFWQLLQFSCLIVPEFPLNFFYSNSNSVWSRKIYFLVLHGNRDNRWSIFSNSTPKLIIIDIPFHLRKEISYVLNNPILPSMLLLLL